MYEIRQAIFVRNLSVKFVVLLAAALAALGADLQPTSPPSPPSRPSVRTGPEEMPLPGFEPMRANGTSLLLGGRKYAWAGSYLPVQIDSRGTPLAGPIQLIGRVRGEAHVLRPSQVSLLESNSTEAVIRARGSLSSHATLEVLTRVEYDGVAMVNVKIIPKESFAIEGLDLRFPVVRTPYSRVLRFDADSIRNRSRPIDLAPSYEGDFQNVVSISDGNRSFWWFADNTDGWILDRGNTTRIWTDSKRIFVVQRLIGRAATVAEPLRLSFNFLATPVRDLGSSWRSERVVPSGSATDASLGRYALWWPCAFAHMALPYTTYPSGVPEQIPKADRAAYPGLEANRERIDSARQRGIVLLPYFSAHVLSVFDPAFKSFKDEWKALPPFVSRQHECSFEAGAGRPWLSHRSSSYSSYLLNRLVAESRNLGFEGLYFDQGGPIDSANPANSWVDSDGKPRPSLDILGLRSFFRRLAEAFKRQGKPGYIFVHNSMSQIVPAYTFVTSMVGGEEFRARLNDDDYIGSVPLDQVRVQYAPHQYGVINTWLPESWFFHRKETGWAESKAGIRAFRNFMTLALLHDVAVWPAGFPKKEWRQLTTALDAFGVGRATFRGYWCDEGCSEAATPGAFVSSYTRADPFGALLVVANLSNKSRVVSVHLGKRLLAREEGLAWRDALGAATSWTRVASEGSLEVRVQGKDFGLVEIAPRADASAGNN